MSNTIVFIHGAWMTPASWSPFKTDFEARGYTCVAPAWPYMDRPLDQLKNSPAPELNQLGVAEIVEHYAEIVSKLNDSPIIIGHSFGGLITQLLLDRGLGVAGVAIDPAPPKGVLPTLGAITNSFPVFRAWMGWKKIHYMSEDAFNKGFANGLTPEEQREAYPTQVVPAPGRIFFQAAFGVANKVKFDNPNRAPLLFVAGTTDRTVPISMVRSNYKKASKSPSPTELAEFEGRCHFQMAQQGWQQVSGRILSWIDAVGAGIQEGGSTTVTPIRPSSSAAD